MFHGAVLLILTNDSPAEHSVIFKSDFFKGHSVNIKLRAKKNKQLKIKDAHVGAKSNLITNKEKISHDKSAGVQAISSRPKHKIVVLYPWAAKKRGLSGIFLAEITIGREGVVQNVLTKKSTGFKVLDKSARAAILNAEFIPAVNNDGLRIDSVLELEIEFKFDSTTL